LTRAILHEARVLKEHRENNQKDYGIFRNVVR